MDFVALIISKKKKKKFYSVLIQERVIEVEDDKVWQAVVRQQVIDVYQDGKLIEKGEVVEVTDDFFFFT